MADENMISPEDQAAEEKGSVKLDLYFWMQALVMALVSLILVFTLVGRVIGVVGSSMVPTLHQSDLLLLQSIGYTPKQGDVVVLRKPSFMTEPIVKRVIAVGGQHVTVDYDAGTVTVDGQALDEPYINELMVDTMNPYMTVLDGTVPEGSIYVMGDNRNHSSDSRDQRLGTVDERYVLGRALCVVLPFQDFGPVG
ncbi:MAG: signal peptidase I [Pseudoflavonifractor sp.]|nr:signal peptidase I [Pseudoflavonifractor sp.]